jgi:hypothetical protein
MGKGVSKKCNTIRLGQSCFNCGAEIKTKIYFCALILLAGTMKFIPLASGWKTNARWTCSGSTVFPAFQSASRACP